MEMERTEPDASDIFKLQAVQAGIDTSVGGKLGVRSYLKDFAVRHHHDAVRVLIVESRCATTMVVRPRISVCSAACT